MISSSPVANQTCSSKMLVLPSPINVLVQKGLPVFLESIREWVSRLHIIGTFQYSHISKPCTPFSKVCQRNSGISAILAIAFETRFHLTTENCWHHYQMFEAIHKIPNLKRCVSILTNLVQSNVYFILLF